MGRNLNIWKAMEKETPRSDTRIGLATKAFRKLCKVRRQRKFVSIKEESVSLKCDIHRLRMLDNSSTNEKKIGGNVNVVLENLTLG